MTQILPFEGILYRVPPEQLPQVLAPPYDVISPAYQDELYARDPRNIVRVILNRNEGAAAYQDAGATFESWLEQGVLAPDPRPGLYVVEQTFEIDGRRSSRRGLLARLRAEPYDSGTILPHEKTRQAPREDRLKLLQATRANFSPIFLMVPDTDGALGRGLAAACGSKPVLEYEDDDRVGHRLWRVSDPNAVAGMQQVLAERRAYIADGHHRYATALAHAETRGNQPAWTLGFFTPLGAPGLVVLPYHRLLREAPPLDEIRERLQTDFDLRDMPGVRAAVEEAARSQAPYAFGLAQPGAGALLATARPEGTRRLEDAPPSLRALDAYALHRHVLPELLGVSEDAVDYVHSLPEAEQAMAQASCRLLVLMRPTPVGQVLAVADARESMPAKSTFFHPKLPSGLVIHRLPA